MQVCGARRARSREVPAHLDAQLMKKYAFVPERIWGSAWRTRSRLLGQNLCGRFWWYGRL
jgi:hypothetical protein